MPPRHPVLDWPLPPSTGVAELRSVPAEGPGEPALKLRVLGRQAPAEAAAHPRPMVLHFHAGAFVSGSAEASALPALLSEAGALTVSLDYPLAPEHPFPQAIEAGYRALLWMKTHGLALSGQTQQLFVAGEEAGGNLAAAVALMARDRLEPLLSGQILVSPMLDVCTGSASQRRAQAGSLDCPWIVGWQRYLPHAADASHPYAAPGSGMRLAGLPATFLMAGRDDPLQDETLAYGRRLRGAGVPVQTLLIDAPTRWPWSFLESRPADAPPPWAGQMRQPLAEFLGRCRA